MCRVGKLPTVGVGVLPTVGVGNLPTVGVSKCLFALRNTEPIHYKIPLV